MLAVWIAVGVVGYILAGAGFVRLYIIFCYPEAEDDAGGIVFWVVCWPILLVVVAVCGIILGILRLAGAKP